MRVTIAPNVRLFRRRRRLPPDSRAQDIADSSAVGGRVVSFPYAGHGAWRDQPDGAMAVLREFISAA